MRQKEEKNLVNHDGTYIKYVVQLKVGSKETFSDWSDNGLFFTFTTDVNGVNQVAMYHLEIEQETRHDINTGEKTILEFPPGISTGSYGGYATLLAAGVARVPVTDLLSMYDLSMEHFKFLLRQQISDPVKDKELWIDCSPITHIQNMKAPLLLVHGTNAPGCPVSQSHIVVEKLKQYGFKEN